MVNEDGTMSRLPDLIEFCEEHDLLLISIADLIRYRRANERLVDPVSQARIPTVYGDFTAHVFRDFDETEHLALAYGQIMGAEEPVLVRAHSECLTGDILASCVATAEVSSTRLSTRYLNPEQVCLSLAQS